MSHFNHKGRPGLVGGSLPRKNTLQSLFEILKGSSTSGNYGHSGRLGKKGGSQAGGGHGKIGIDRTQDIKSQIDSYRSNKKSSDDFYNKEWLMGNKLNNEDAASQLATILGTTPEKAKVMVGKAFSYKDEETGFTTSIDSFQPSIVRDKVVISGSIYDSDGIKVGNYSREIYPDGTIHHALFELDSDKQGSGFGSRFYENAEKAYKEGGIKAVHLKANLQVGGYAWGRMGFDFSDNSTRELYKSIFDFVYKRRYGKSIEEIPNTAYEMASYVGPDGHRLGKEAMLGSSWSAYKSLKDDDIGYQVGQAYYKNKKGKK